MTSDEPRLGIPGIVVRLHVSKDMAHRCGDGQGLHMHRVDCLFLFGLQRADDWAQNRYGAMPPIKSASTLYRNSGDGSENG